MLEIKVHGLDELQSQLRKFSNSPVLKKALKVLGQIVASQTIERFEDEVDPDGQRWKALKKPREGGLILNHTGQLKRISYQVKGDSVKIGPTVNYGIFHQFGTKKMEARPFLGVNYENYTEMEYVLIQQLRKHYGN